VDFVNTHIEENPSQYGHINAFVYHLDNRTKCKIVKYCIDTGYVDRLAGSVRGLPISREEDDQLFTELLANSPTQPKMFSVFSESDGRAISEDALRQRIHDIRTSTMNEHQRMEALTHVLKDIFICNSTHLEDFTLFIDELRLRIFDYLDRFLGAYEPFAIYSVRLHRYSLYIQYDGDYRIMQWEQEHIDRKGVYSPTPLDVNEQYTLD